MVSWNDLDREDVELAEEEEQRIGEGDSRALGEGGLLQ